jgi:hypothetical protein
MNQLKNYFIIIWKLEKLFFFKIVSVWFVIWGFQALEWLLRSNEKYCFQANINIFVNKKFMYVVFITKREKNAHLKGIGYYENLFKCPKSTSLVCQKHLFTLNLKVQLHILIKVLIYYYNYSKHVFKPMCFIFLYKMYF